MSLTACFFDNLEIIAAAPSTGTSTIRAITLAGRRFWLRGELEQQRLSGHGQEDNE